MAGIGKNVLMINDVAGTDKESYLLLPIQLCFTSWYHWWIICLDETLLKQIREFGNTFKKEWEEK